ncbi:hypothetical protein HK101_003707, partial [Irineochytrium annulatum]
DALRIAQHFRSHMLTPAAPSTHGGSSDAGSVNRASSVFSLSTIDNNGKRASRAESEVLASMKRREQEVYEQMAAMEVMKRRGGGSGARVVGAGERGQWREMERGGVLGRDGARAKEDLMRNTVE